MGWRRRRGGRCSGLRVLVTIVSSIFVKIHGGGVWFAVCRGGGGGCRRRVGAGQELPDVTELAGLLHPRGHTGACPLTVAGLWLLFLSLLLFLYVLLALFLPGLGGG